jgi:hypothetical protein
MSIRAQSLAAPPIVFAITIEHTSLIRNGIGRSGDGPENPQSVP